MWWYISVLVLIYLFFTLIPQNFVDMTINSEYKKLISIKHQKTQCFDDEILAYELRLQRFSEKYLFSQRSDLSSLNFLLFDDAPESNTNTFNRSEEPQKSKNKADGFMESESNNPLKKVGGTQQEEQRRRNKPKLPQNRRPYQSAFEFEAKVYIFIILAIILYTIIFAFFLIWQMHAVNIEFDDELLILDEFLEPDE